MGMQAYYPHFIPYLNLSVTFTFITPWTFITVAKPDIWIIIEQLCVIAREQKQHLGPGDRHGIIVAYVNDEMKSHRGGEMV